MLGKKKAKDMMTQDPDCCTPQDTIQQAAQIMAQDSCGALPVVDRKESKHLIGMITDRDIACRAVAQGKGPDTKVQDCMTQPAVSVSPEASLEECIQAMEKNQIRRVAVADEAGNCCGVVTQAHIARHAPDKKVAEVVKTISKPTNIPSKVAAGVH